MSYTQLYTYKTKEFGAFPKKNRPTQYSVLGIPFDFTSTYRPGSRFGPNAIREASINLEAYCLRRNFDVESVALEDLGDLEVLGEAEGTIRRQEKVLAEVIEADRFPIVLGGEHTITYGSVKSFEKTAVLSFDAHLDLREEYLGRCLSHATCMRRIYDDLGPELLFEVGVRALSTEELDFAQQHGVKYLTSLELSLQGSEKVASDIRSWASQFDRLYISIDMDVLDPAYAPAVGNPVPEGLSPTQLIDILHDIVTRCVVGLDVVEVSPIYDSGITAIQASNLIYNIIAFRETSRT